MSPRQEMNPPLLVNGEKFYTVEPIHAHIEIDETSSSI